MGGRAGRPERGTRTSVTNPTTVLPGVKSPPGRKYPQPLDPEPPLLVRFWDQLRARHFFLEVFAQRRNLQLWARWRKVCAAQSCDGREWACWTKNKEEVACLRRGPRSIYKTESHAMTKRRCFALLLCVLALPFGAGCIPVEEDARGFDGEFCTVNEHCQLGATCVDKVCVAAPEVDLSTPEGRNCDKICTRLRGGVQQHRPELLQELPGDRQGLARVGPGELRRLLCRRGQPGYQLHRGTQRGRTKRLLQPHPSGRRAPEPMRQLRLTRQVQHHRHRPGVRRAAQDLPADRPCLPRHRMEQDRHLCRPGPKHRAVCRLSERRL